MNTSKYIRNVRTSAVFNFSNLTKYNQGCIESRALIQRDDISLTLFAFDKDEEVSSYSIPGDSLITVIEGELEVIEEADNIKHKLLAGDSIIIALNSMYSYRSIIKTKIVVTIVKEPCFK